MDNLQKAYLNVYNDIDEATAMVKRGYDEAPIRQQIAKNTGGGAAADRASALEKKSTFGDAKKEKQRQNYARAQRGDFRKTTSSNPGLHVGQHKSNDSAVQAKQAARGAQRSPLTPKERQQLNREDLNYNELLKFLYFEGYAESYAEAEELLESLSDEEFDEILEAYKEPDLAKMKKQEERHRTAAVKQRGGSRGSSKNRAFKMSSIRGSLERGEDPRADTYGGAQKKPVDHRADYSKNPLNNPPRPVKKPGVNESVVEYLFVEGYADTIEKAEIMAENISENWEIEILEAAKDQTDKQIDKGVKTTYKAGNVLDNQHQGRSSGLNRLSGTEREAKEKRMRGRLKSRRDDLFGERNKREDAKREELKKMLGL